MHPARQMVREVLADNIRAGRARANLSQTQASARMAALGFDTWSRATVSEIERGNRGLLVDELVALAMVYEVALDELIRPRVEGKIDLHQPENMLTAAAVLVMAGHVAHPSEWLDGEPHGLHSHDHPWPWPVAPRDDEGW